MSSIPHYRLLLLGSVACFMLGGPMVAAHADDDPFGCRKNPENCLPGDPPASQNNTTYGPDNTGVPKPTKQEIVRENKAKLACNKRKTAAARQQCLNDLQ